MKKFMFLMYGYEVPTPEIMAAWNKWFESIKDHIIEQGGLRIGREISKTGTKELPLDLEAITGFVIVRAANLEEAERLAVRNPYISSIRLYEVVQK